jgi:hypothetical protein
MRLNVLRRPITVSIAVAVSLTLAAAAPAPPRFADTRSSALHVA